MDELERTLRDVLTAERLDVPLAPGAVEAVHRGVRRRRRARTVGAVLAVVAVISAGAATASLVGPGGESVGPVGPVESTTPTATPTKPKAPLSHEQTVVAWADLPYDPAKPPAFPGTVADPHVPWCTAKQLSAALAFQGATGNLVGGTTVTNTSSTVCALSGQPLVRVRSASGRVLVASQPDDFYVSAWVALPPGGEATASVSWFQEFCREPAPASVDVTLPHSGGTLSVASTATPRCNAPVDPPSAGSVAVSGFVRRSAPNVDAPFTPEAALDATIDRFSRSVVAGGVVTYRVELQSMGDPVALDPCLPFRERLVDRSTGVPVADEMHVLDCEAAPSTIGTPESMHPVFFDMRLRVPTTTTPGDYALDWQSVLQPVEASAEDVVHVRAAPPQCRSDQLGASAGRNGAGTGHVVQVVVLTNTSQATCSLRGYPGVQFVDEAGAKLPTEPHHGGSYLFPDLPMTTVVLAPGGTASFGLGGVHFDTLHQAACPPAAGVLVIPPELRQQVPVPVHWPYCDHGAVDVSVVVAGSAGPR